VRRQWGVRVVAGCLVAVAALSGCAEKHEASTTLPSASSTSGEGLPPLGPADFPVPDEARRQTEAGVLAFGSYYFDLSNSSLASRDTSQLRQLSRDCVACDELADSFDADRAAGNTYQGGGLSITGTGTVVVNESDAHFSFVVQQAARTVLDAQGNPLPDRASPAYQFTRGMRLAWDSSRVTWLVTQLDAERIP